MIQPPFVARVAAGLAVTAMEEAKKLPSTAVTLPMTAVSQMLQTSMRLQQSITSLAIKGDQAFALIKWSTEDEQPEWAVFDEDEDAPTPDSPEDSGSATDSPDGETSANAGRFALYSLEPTAPMQTPVAAETTGSGADVPDVVDDLDYANLTLAQLRARIRTLRIEQLTALLDYENATLSRAPYQTMLGNRITTAKAK